MPIYPFRCPSCGARHEIRQSMRDHGVQRPRHDCTTDAVLLTSVEMRDMPEMVQELAPPALRADGAYSFNA